MAAPRRPVRRRSGSGRPTGVGGQVAPQRPRARVSSPVPGCSTLITSTPGSGPRHARERPGQRAGQIQNPGIGRAAVAAIAIRRRGDRVLVDARSGQGRGCVGRHPGSAVPRPRSATGPAMLRHRRAPRRSRRTPASRTARLGVRFDWITEAGRRSKRVHGGAAAASQPDADGLLPIRVRRAARRVKARAGGVRQALRLRRR